MFLIKKLPKIMSIQNSGVSQFTEESDGHKFKSNSVQKN